MIRKMLPMWVWGVMAMAFMVLTVGISVGFTIYWVHQGFSNECDALNYIIDHGHLTNHTFEGAVIRWADADGCR